VHCITIGFVLAWSRRSPAVQDTTKLSRLRSAGPRACHRFTFIVVDPYALVLITGIGKEYGETMECARPVSICTGVHEWMRPGVHVTAGVRVLPFTEWVSDENRTLNGWLCSCLAIFPNPLDVRTRHSTFSNKGSQIHTLFQNRRSSFGNRSFDAFQLEFVPLSTVFMIPDAFEQGSVK